MFFDNKSRFQSYEDNHSCFFIGGLISGVGSLASGALGVLGTTQATAAQAKAQQNALNFQQNVYGQESANLAPYVYTGQGAVNALYGNIGTLATPGGLTESPTAYGGIPSAPTPYNLPNYTLSQFQQSPGYQWQLQQGVNAIQNAAGPKTGVLSGNTLQALQTYGTGLANQDWWNWLNNQQNNYNTGYQANNQNYWNQYNAAAAQQQNWLNILGGLASGGQSAGTLSGPTANLVGGIGNAMSNIGSTQAAGILGTTGAINNAISPGGGLSTGFNQIGNALNNYFTNPYGGTDTGGINQDFSGGAYGSGY